jgi:hypothetical protein
MNLQRRLCAGLTGCILMMTCWVCAPLYADPPAPAAAAAPAAVVAKGPLPAPVAAQVRAIVMAEIKAFVPPTEEGAVELRRLDKNTVLGAMVDGQEYLSKVFRRFVAQPLSPTEMEVKEYYVRTIELWKLKGNLVIPADTYLSGIGENVGAYDADMIAAQDAAIARDEVLRKAALDQLEVLRKARIATIAEAHKAESDAITKQITQLKAEAAQKEATRNAIIKANIALTQIKSPVIDTTNRYVAVREDLLKPPPRHPVTTKDGNGNIIWQWSPKQGFTFNDGLNQNQQAQEQTLAAQAALQARMDGDLRAVFGWPGVKAKALHSAFKTHRKNILDGAVLTEDVMRHDYEVVLGEPLKAPPNPADAKPPAAPAAK